MEPTVPLTSGYAEQLAPVYAAAAHHLKVLRKPCRMAERARAIADALNGAAPDLA